MKPTSTENQAGPVAVIAVHGVADQKKDETAVKTVDLLLHLDGLKPEKEGTDPSGTSYEGFREEKIRVGVKPLDVSSVDEENAWNYQLREHLKDYEDDDGKVIYEAMKVEGQRVTRSTPDGEPKFDRKVDVYEMHWADVSKLKFGIFNLFAAIYRLLFETSWLGKQVIGKWASFGQDVGRFSSITSLRGIMVLLHSIATFMLTRFMPVMYILMICMLMLTGVPALESEWASPIFTGMGGYNGLLTLGFVVLIAGAMIFTASSFWRRIPWPPVYVVIVLVCFFIANLSLAFLHGRSGSWWAESGLTMILWIGMCLLLNAFLLPFLNRVFPGTRIVGNFLILFFTVGLILGLCHRTNWPLLISGPLQALRFGSALMPMAWIILASAANLFLLLAMFEMFTLWFRRGLGKEIRRKRRSRLRSAIVSITLPVLLVSFLNAAFFQLTLVPAKLGGLDGVRAIPNRSVDAPREIDGFEEKIHQHIEPIVSRWSSIPDFEEWSENNKGPRARFSDFAVATSTNMVIPFMEMIFLIIILVLGYSLWIVTPAFWAERNLPVKTEGKKWEKLSIALGKNLTQGYKWIWFGQAVLVFCLFVTQGLFAYRGARAGAIAKDPNHGKNSPPMVVLFDQFLGLRNTEMNTPLAEASVVSNRQPGPDNSRRIRPYQQRGDDYKRDRIRRSVERIWQKRDSEIFRRDEPGAPPRTTAAGSNLSLKETLLTEAVVFLNNGPLTSALGFGILALGIGYLFFARLADPLVGGLRGGLDMALDVVSYLHPFPRNHTTRAQILNRYASLLKHIVDWRDPVNPEVRYSRVVIITHSQGNVITSDLLRALSLGTVAKDSGLSDLRFTPGSDTGVPIRMLSLGSPLVQLYNARFPELYDWDPTADPRLNHHGLESWWNLYRSGDYVGRMIFRDPKDKTAYLPEVDFVMSQNGQNIPIRETCIGPGAHTHYWGENASELVIQKLDCLIACDDVDELAKAEDEDLT